MRRCLSARRNATIKSRSSRPRHNPARLPPPSKGLQSFPVSHRIRVEKSFAFEKADKGWWRAGISTQGALQRIR